MDDSETEVAVAAVRSLAVLVNLLEDEDKLCQVAALVRDRLVQPATPPDIITELTTSLVPVLNIWLLQSLKFCEDFFSKLLPGLESMTKEDSKELEDLNMEPLKKRLELVESQLPYLVLPLLSSCPAPGPGQEKTETGEHRPPVHPDLLAIDWPQVNRCR